MEKSKRWAATVAVATAGLVGSGLSAAGPGGGQWTSAVKTSITR